MYKRLVVILLASVFFLLSACSSEGSSSSAETTLTFWNRLPELTTHFEEFIDQFEEEHPEIAIEMETLGASGNQQYQTAIKNNELPDLFVTANVTSVKNLVEQELLHNLDEVLTEEVREQFHSGIWNENFMALNDSIYQLPLNSGASAVLMFYNKDVLENYGISEEQIPTQWDEFKEMGKEIYEQSDGNVYGLLMGAESTWLSDMTINQMATNITPEVHPSIDLARQINYKTGEVDFVNDGNIETINYINSLMEENVLAPASVEYDEPTAVANFAAGKSAFFFGGNWTGSNLVNAESGPGFENWGVAPLPTKNGDGYYNDTLPKEGIMVSNNTEHWEEVKTFLEYFIEHGYEDVIIKSGAHAPPMDIDISEEEIPFEQYEEVINLTNEHTLTVPDIYGRNLDSIEVVQDYQGALSYSVGSILSGYLQGEVKDPVSELEKAEQQGQQAFDDALSEQENVEQSDFIFEDWVPMEPYVSQ